MSTESPKEMLSRLELMIEPDSKWDLSDNDKAAIRFVLNRATPAPESPAPAPLKCESCDGSGHYPLMPDGQEVECSACEGTGSETSPDAARLRKALEQAVRVLEVAFPTGQVSEEHYGEASAIAEVIGCCKSALEAKPAEASEAEQIPHPVAEAEQSPHLDRPCYAPDAILARSIQKGADCDDNMAFDLATDGIQELKIQGYIIVAQAPTRTGKGK